MKEKRGEGGSSARSGEAKGVLMLPHRCNGGCGGGKRFRAVIMAAGAVMPVTSNLTLYYLQTSRLQLLTSGAAPKAHADPAQQQKMDFGGGANP